MLGPVLNPEKVFTVSMEADIYPLESPDLADVIDGAIGEGSKFHETNGYYAQGVGPDTAILPRDWLLLRCDRFVPLEVCCWSRKRSRVLYGVTRIWLPDTRRCARYGFNDAD